MEESNIKKVLNMITRKKRVWDERSTQAVETVNMYMTRYANIRDSYNEQYPSGLPILVSGQVQRSGGTLFSQLFDGHSEIMVHPHEILLLKAGYFTVRDLKRRVCRTKNAFRRINRNGYTKGSVDGGIHPLFFNGELLLKKVMNQRCKNRNEVISFYFDNFFKYWFNYNNFNLHCREKKLICGFSPRLGFPNLGALLDENPRITFVHIYRNPCSWWVSSRLHCQRQKTYEDISSIDTQWRVNQEVALESLKTHSRQTIILSFDDLITQTERVMKVFCKRFDIAYGDVLKVPTFNNKPIGADSSFKTNKEPGKINVEPTERYKEILDKGEIDFINTRNGELMNQMNDLSNSFFEI
jgi:hypothetical protein